MSGDSKSDQEQLIDQARNGDVAAMTTLFNDYRERLARMIHLRMDDRVKARVDVADVLQDAYLDLTQQLENYAKDPKLPFFLWVRRITGQRLAKTHRLHLGQEKRDAARDIVMGQVRMPDASSVFLANQLQGEFTSPSGRFARQENQDRVQTAIESLPETDREIIALRHVEQLSNAESALVLDLSEKAASKRYIRALRHLRTELQQNPESMD